MTRYLRIAKAFLPTIGFTFLLLIIRILYSGSLMYVFLLWNIFLAGIPVFFSITLLKHKSDSTSQSMILFLCWLLFFPNSLYIITDLVHLEPLNNIPLWFDIVLLFSAASNGLLAGYLSLSHIEEFLTRRFPTKVSKLILAASMIAGSFGVYIGRYLRWNSWDVVTNPFGLFSEIIQRVVYPFDHLHTWSITFVFSLFFIVFYFAMKNLQERNVRE